MRLIRDEIERDMRLMGCDKLQQLDSSMLASRRD
jgi:isopentenyl diphosphate isomerase/L-lactate dehydrogenase-like FMN-dependent dehydrogenase